MAREVQEFLGSFANFAGKKWQIIERPDENF
jgi:hypothetical protein